jgi:hypothetical protein
VFDLLLLYLRLGKSRLKKMRMIMGKRMELTKLVVDRKEILGVYLERIFVVYDYIYRLQV